MNDGGTPTPYLHYDEDLAACPAAEDALIAKMIEDLRKNSEHQFAKSKKNRKLWRNGKPHAIRDAHAKSCAVLRGELTVLPDLPEPYRQGIFAEPGRRYPLIARISATSGAIRSDQVRGVRGLGLKVLGVDSPSGRRAHKRFSEDANQDFVFVTEPVFLFRDAAHYAGAGMRTAKALAHLPDTAIMFLNRALRAARRVARLAGRDLPRNLRVFAEPNYHVLGQTFYTAAPIRFGAYVAKLSVSPASKATTDLVATTIPRRDPEALTNAVQDHFRSNDAYYVVSAQLCTNTDDMPIEDATVEWSEADSPYRPVAFIHYPRQTAHSNALLRFGDDELTFNSWRGIDEHRPLGSINRLKLRVYDESSIFRHEHNGADYVEPADLSVFPR